MKKILFATTALVMTAGAASAEISWSGFGRFGVVYEDNGTDDKTFLEQRFQLDVEGTTETDTGLVVGGKYRIRSQETAVGNDADDAGYLRTTEAATVNAAQMFITSGGLTLEVGNIDYALDSMANLALGTIGLQNFTSFLDGPGYASRGASNTGVAVLYSMGGLNAHLSYDMQDEATDAYVSYDFAGYTFGVGGQDSDTYATEWVVAFGGTVGTVDFNASYVDNGDAGAGYGLAGHMAVASGVKVGGYLSYDDASEDTGFGLDASYALGGGANLVGGAYTIGDVTEADFGINFRF
ncbi:porin [Pseudooceanicola sediminis]|uniref:Porin n=1 Tax=Pseudooceanicola sediminis TaxID=2211117 RepID=A0A399IZF6_9RHOB|nr:porin [Pseudooceanicola sediminis]KAA2313374.1 porin [Puniceibacterium sp. HSS470]RII38344.1 porin [Pseudooceanicola sediminis]|tara:strand:+ start:25870 stop:26754 length:885 start_codon:yes stop_codon:yes gene_type:complete